MTDIIPVALGALDPELTSPGLGAWTFFYRYRWTPSNDRERAGLLAMKQALVSNGYGKGIDLAMQVFGDAATNRTKEFQAAQGLFSDGVIGPRTARALFRVYFDSEESASPAIPGHLLAKIGCGESNDDPIAEGVLDAADEGLLQFHLPYWPGTTLAQAWSPTYEIGKGGEKLRTLRRQTGSWKGAVAGWNIGTTYAAEWVTADYPATGGPLMGTDPNGNPIYAFERATNYWAYIDALPY